MGCKAVFDPDLEQGGNTNVVVRRDRTSGEAFARRRTPPSDERHGLATRFLRSARAKAALLRVNWLTRRTVPVCYHDTSWLTGCSL